jgi:hypothetical protein
MVSSWKIFIHLKGVEKLESKSSNIANAHRDWVIPIIRPKKRLSFSWTGKPFHIVRLSMAGTWYTTTSNVPRSA